MSHLPAAAGPKADGVTRHPGTLGRSLLASVEIVVSPAEALGALRRTSSWVPLLSIALLRTAWLFVEFSPSLAPAKVLLSFVLQAMLSGVEYLIVGLAIAALLYVRGGRFRFSELFRAVVLVGFLYEFICFVLAVAGRAFGADEITPGNQYLTDLGWMIPASESLPLHHVLSMLDLLVLYCAYRLVQGLGIVVGEMSRPKLATSLAVCWLACAMITTSIKIHVS
jgi:hypothetical protein